MAYSCGICKTKLDQISHHKAHLETEKHKDKKELFELKLSKLKEDELEKKYKTSNIKDIIEQTETIINIKKVKNDKCYNNTLINNISNENITEIMDKSNGITNKDALKDKIHEIHNYLRNHGAGYGMNALKVFNIIYGLKKIEENDLIDKVGIKRPECEFKCLLNLANKNKGDEIVELLTKDILDSINDSDSILKDLLFYELPTNIKGDTYIYLIKEINNISNIEKTCNVLLSGKIYEYFIGRDKSAISELGAYFTDRHIVDYIMNKLNPKINEDGSILSMIDMFGGSGGFTTGYINYLNNNYKNQIKWCNEINKILHFDANEDVIKYAGLEFLCLTGELPNMNNLQYKNSFTDEFNNQKYKYPITNPPYGGDETKKTETQNKRDKIKEYIKNILSTDIDVGRRIILQKQYDNIKIQEKEDKIENDKKKVNLTTCSRRIQNFAKKHKLKPNDKESCSLILLMDIIEFGGTSISVLKEGVFFNKTYKDLRRCLIENYNVREIISVPSDQFENTSTKTSILIFDNIEEKTKEVKFSNLIVNKYKEDKFIESENGEILISECKDNIYSVTDEILSVATKEEILNNSICSLNGKDYKNKENIYFCNEEYEMVKLGDICEYLPKSKRNASFGKEDGEYNFYTSSNKIQKCDIADYDKECIIIGTGGNSCIHYNNKSFSCSADTILITSLTNIKYLYYIILSTWDNLIQKMTGSTIRHITKDMLTKHKIPIPKDKNKMLEWVEKISKPYNEKNEKQQKVEELELYVKNRIKEINENEECEEIKLGDICKVFGSPGGSNLSMFERHTNIDNNKYGFIRGADISNKLKKPLYYISEYDYKKYYDGKNNIVKHNDILLTACSQTLTFKIVPVEWNGYAYHGCLKFSNLKNISSNYLVYYMNSDNYTKNILNLQSGSVVKYSNASTFINSILKIPKNKQLINDLEQIFKEIETLKQDIVNADNLYKQYINDLNNETMNNN
jgi:type I restriction-modification system DNA methylase subunit